MKGTRKMIPVTRNYLITYRMRLNITQYEVSRRAGFLQCEYNLIENGYKGARMDARKLKRLAAALEVPVTEFLDAEAEYLDLYEAKNNKEKKWY